MLHTPILDRGTAFTEAERLALGLVGLLPAGLSSMEGPGPAHLRPAPPAVIRTPPTPEHQCALTGERAELLARFLLPALVAAMTITGDDLVPEQLCWWPRDWQRASLWQRLHYLLLDELGRNSGIDWSPASLDSLSVRPTGGLPDRPEPDRPRQARVHAPPAGRRRGIPRRQAVGGQYPRLDAGGCRRRCAVNQGSTESAGRPHRRPAKRHGDKGYDLLGFMQLPTR